MLVARDCGVDGVMLGPPNYFPLTVRNAIQIYQDVADAFPTLPILICHNPLLFRTALPIAHLAWRVSNKRNSARPTRASRSSATRRRPRQGRRRSLCP